MWVFVYFDLPTSTKHERKAYSKFRKQLISDGFSMMQYSVYNRHCISRERANVHVARVKQNLPDAGKVSILLVTDKQFGKMQNFWGNVPEESKNPPITQLAMF